MPVGPRLAFVARLCRTRSDTTFPMVCFRAAAIVRAAARMSSSKSSVVLILNASDVKREESKEFEQLQEFRSPNGATYGP